MPGDTSLISKLLALVTRIGTEFKTLRSEMSTAIADAKTAVKNEILGGASAAYDTLKEIEEFLKSNDTVVAALQALKIVKYDAAQELTSEEKGTARSNIGAAADADLTALATRMGTAEGSITDHGTRLTAAEGDIDALENAMGDLTDVNFVTTFEAALADSGSESGGE